MTNFMSKQTIYIFIVVTGLTAQLMSCRSQRADKSYEDVTKRFGEMLLNGNFTSAHAMLTTHLQSRLSPDQLKQNYMELQAKGSVIPEKILSDFGDLPADRNEAEEIYSIDPSIPFESYKAWMFVNFVDEQENGFEARLLIVSEEGILKIGHVEFDWLDS
ncbi:hypothetical protein JW979_08690 [bacterium]|nr:hypothetical protein [candidate division CSSED10-310 bacterium]